MGLRHGSHLWWHFRALEVLDDEQAIELPVDTVGIPRENPLVAIDTLVENFKVPLREGADAQLDDIHCEFEAMVSYAGQFISLSILYYQSVWWRSSHVPNSAEWANALTLAPLLFSLPVSNWKLERAFSQISLIKDKSDHLLVISP